MEPRIALIKITEPDINKLRLWPLRDGVLAEALERLERLRPAAIGIDLYRDVNEPPGHAEFEAVLKRYPNIIATYKFRDSQQQGIAPPPVLLNSKRIGISDMVIDPGGIIRRGLLLVVDGDQNPHFSFALCLALRYLQRACDELDADPDNRDAIRLGQTTLPALEPNFGGYREIDNGGYQFMLDYRRDPYRFDAYTFSQLLEDQLDPGKIKDRVVLIGLDAESVKDHFYTPLRPHNESSQALPGVALHGLIVGQLLRTVLEQQPPLKTWSELQEYLWVLGWTLTATLAGFLSRSPWHFTGMVGGGVALLGISAWLAFQANWWLPAAWPILSWLSAAILSNAYRVKQENQERALLMNLFARHVSPEIAEEIWQHRDQFLTEGRPRPQKTMATVMFTDVQGFTSLAEQMEPQVLLDWLNDYLAGITPEISAHGGVVLRFIGDAILAVFGVPVPRRNKTEVAEDARRAVQCALAMEAQLIAMNHRWQSQNLPVVGMRIGIYTGPVVAGSIGDHRRLEYNIHGDTVNTAARLESFAKESFVADALRRPCRILIGETTRAYLGSAVTVEMVGEVSLRGKHQAIKVYQVQSQSNAGVDSTG